MEVTDSVLCYTCATAGQQNKLTQSAASKLDGAFGGSMPLSLSGNMNQVNAIMLVLR